MGAEEGFLPVELVSGSLHTHATKQKKKKVISEIGGRE
jgi:hypothetical protein